MSLKTDILLGRVDKTEVILAQSRKRITPYA